MVYRIEWVSEKAVLEAAANMGWRCEDGTSLWDWVEPDDFIESVIRKTFKGAVSAARQAIPFDATGEVAIYRQVRVRRSNGQFEFEDRECWHVFDGKPDPTERAPSHVYPGSSD